MAMGIVISRVLLGWIDETTTIMHGPEELCTLSEVKVPFLVNHFVQDLVIGLLHVDPAPRSKLIQAFGLLPAHAISNHFHHLIERNSKGLGEDLEVLP